MFETLTKSIHRYWHDFIAALPRLAMAILIVAIGILVARWISRLFQKRISHKDHDPLMGRFLAKTIRLIIIVAVIMLGLRAAGLSGIAGALLGLAGASAVVVGFAFKDIAENFLAGIILAFNRPFQIEETIQIDSTFGKVKDMAFRYTQIKTFDGRDVYIPNADVLKKPLTNFTGSGYYRLEFVVGIAYESDIDQAKTIVQDILDEDQDLVHDDSHVNFVIEDELATYSVNLKVFLWVTTDDYRRGALEKRGQIIRKVKVAFDKAGIYIPCAVQEIKQYGAAAPGKAEVQKPVP